MNTVLRNLLTNAIKFTPSGGGITVSCEDAGNRVHTKVSDTGVGIAKEDADKLFRSDVHFTTYGTNNEQGTGLGLITCNDFIRMHKGSIEVHSKPNEGTTFTVILPKED